MPRREIISSRHLNPVSGKHYKPAKPRTLPKPRKVPILPRPNTSKVKGRVERARARRLKIQLRDSGIIP